MPVPEPLNDAPSLLRGSKAPAPDGDTAFPLSPADQFQHRHIGPTAEDTRQMLDLLGYPSLDALIDTAVPAPIRSVTCCPTRSIGTLLWWGG